ncbi:MAG: hypothetical protein ABSF43_00540 [Rectinemataceae bacterium]|jgi:hypothetical protein
MDDFIARLGFRGALQLYLFLVRREDELEGGVAELYAALRTYLYDRLSIEDMESPETLLAKLDER